MKAFIYRCPDCKADHEYGSAGAELYCGVCIRGGRKVLLRRNFQKEQVNVNTENLRRR